MNGLIHDYFRNEILCEETENLIPSIESVVNNSLVKINCASVVQDCIEDEYFQPFINVSEDGSVINSGLWTRSLYDPSGRLVTNSSIPEPDYSKLQVRKRLLAVCKKTEKPFIICLYRNTNTGETEEEWEKWRQDTFKMNSLHNLIGIYESADDDEDFSSENGSNEVCLPTVHLIKRSSGLIIDNLIPVDQLEGIRARLVGYLSDCLGGSKLAAESLVLSLVSRHSLRVDGLVENLFIGKLSLNLSVNSSANDSASDLKNILQGIKPFVSGPIRLDANLEKETIYPRLNLQTGQLSPNSQLQQPDGSVLVIDETCLSEGEFKDQAVCNLQSLIDLIRFQHVNYDFGMQQIPIKTDMPVISVSLNKKSVLPFDLKVECDEIRFMPISEEDRLKFLSYLYHCRELNCVVTEEMASFLEQDYIALRKSSPMLPNGNPKMNEQEFHRLMNLARLTAVSHGQVELSKEIWVQTKELYNN